MASDTTTPPPGPPGSERPPLRPPLPPPPPPVRRSGWLGRVVLAIVVLAVFGIALRYTYDLGVEHGLEMAPPLIRAEVGPAKIAPEQPGGMEIPHQDKLVYDGVSSDQSGVEQGELLPPPEEPAAKPAPEAGEGADVLTFEDEPAAIERAEPATVSEEEQASTADIAAKADALIASTVPPPPPPVSEDASDGQDAGAAPPEESGVTKEGEGAEEQAALTTGAAAVEPAGPGRFKVQIAAFRSSEAADAGWQRLRAAHEDLLGGLTHAVVRADLGAEKGIYYRLQAGPLADAAAARALCDKFKAREQGCFVVRP